MSSNHSPSSGVQARAPGGVVSLHVVLPGGVVRTGGTLVDVLVTVHLFQVAREVVARDVLLAERTLKVKDFKLVLHHMCIFIFMNSNC